MEPHAIPAPIALPQPLHPALVPPRDSFDFLVFKAKANFSLKNFFQGSSHVRAVHAGVSLSEEVAWNVKLPE